MHWTKDLAYTITPKSGPMRRMETLLDANRALSNDLPTGFLKRGDWLAAGKLLVHASETGAAADIQRATDELLKVVESEGWMSRARRFVEPIAPPIQLNWDEIWNAPPSMP